MNYMPMEAAPPYEFAAQPQLLKAGTNKYRDSYQELIKIAPQNIMYDRRVVRGNTYAAMIIPVQFQSEVDQEKAKLREVDYRRKLELEQRFRTDEEIKQQRVMEEEKKMRLDEELRQPWEILDDPGIDERTIEPDFYVDRPPTPEFIPNPAKEDKGTQIGDLELFDFELEAEPILEVLIGKAIEQGRIEAIEEWERVELLKHKQEYAKIREAELLEAQRLESIHNHSIEETRRRLLQQEANKQLKIHAQQKLLARLICRNTLSGMGEGAIQFLEAAGVLRAPREHDMQTLYIPHLMALTEEQIEEQAKEKPLLEAGLGTMVLALAKEHRDSIVEEYKRRHNKIDKERRERDERIIRRATRAIKRADKQQSEWLIDLKAQIENQVVGKASHVEDPTQVKILELSLENSGQALYVVGGLLGEILLTASEIHEVLIAPDPEVEQPEGADAPVVEAPAPFVLTTELIEAIIRNSIEPFLAGETFVDIPLLCDTDFADILNPEDPKDGIDYDNLVTPGLRYLINKMERYGLNPEVVTKLFSGIIRFKHKKLQEPQELLPELPSLPEEKLEELPEEEKAAEKEKIKKENENIAAQNEEIKAKNEEIKAKNEELQKENDFTIQLQNKIRILVAPELLEYGKTCAVAWIGSVEDAGPFGHGEENAGKRNPKAAQLSIIKHLCVSNTVSDLKLLILNKNCQADIRKAMLSSVKKVFSNNDKYKVDRIMEKITEKYDKFERGFLRHLHKHLKYKGYPIPVFNYGASETELGEKSPEPVPVAEEFPAGEEQNVENPEDKEEAAIDE